MKLSIFQALLHTTMSNYNLATQAVAKGNYFEMKLPGSNLEEQTDNIRSSLEWDLDGIELDQRPWRIEKYLNQINNPNSRFWLTHRNKRKLLKWMQLHWIVISNITTNAFATLQREKSRKNTLLHLHNF